ncbi:MAG TPA: hypothetical protein VIV60_12235, partial [Polyangiaceae bacterium]
SGRGHLRHLMTAISYKRHEAKSVNSPRVEVIPSHEGKVGQQTMSANERWEFFVAATRNPNFNMKQKECFNEKAKSDTSSDKLRFWMERQVAVVTELLFGIADGISSGGRWHFRLQ